MSEQQRRCEQQPGLFKAAESACVYYLTDGFCTPRNVGACKCWDAADALMRGSGMSAQACSWVFQHTKEIERLADAKLQAQQAPATKFPVKP